MKLGIEVGGTFTDLILIGDDGRVLATAKTFSTPADPGQGVSDALALLSGHDLSNVALVHGSTVATNAVLERKGPTLGFLATAGFKDLLELQRQDRDSIYDLHYVKPRPLAARDHCAEVPERLNARGEVVRALDQEGAVKAIEELAASGVTAIAVCLLHSYRNPEHERRVLSLIKELFPDTPVSISSDVVAEFREYERASTTTIDAFVKPMVERYVGHLDERAASLGMSRLSLMQSNGGLLPSAYVRDHPAQMLFSGPAAGVIGAATVAHASNLDNIITLDMGGTSADVCLMIEGRPSITTEATIDRIPLRVPMIDIVSVGAGGGSIVWMDQGGMLQVGPQSAGAVPGPACYGRGGELPTVTDANVVRGLIRSHRYLAGRFPLDGAAASRALQTVAERLRRDVKQFAEDVCRIANTTMADAIRVVSVERGRDPRDYTLVAYGGAGPLHAAGVADELNIGSVLIPPYPGLISAYGLAVANYRRDFAVTEAADLQAITIAEISQTFERLEGHARSEARREGIALESIDVARALDMRYRGQGFELTVPLTPDTLLDGSEALERRFHDAHAARYGHSRPGDRIQVVTYRVTVSVPTTKPSPPTVESTAIREPEMGRAAIAGTVTPCAFLWRAAIPIGETFVGPAIVEEETSTTFVPNGWQATVEKSTGILLERTGVRHAG